MRNRTLGGAGLAVSELGLGCMNLSMGYGGRPCDEMGIAILERAVDLGITFFDTAELYGPFTNEELLGRGLRAVRDKVVIATKFGFRIEPGVARPNGVDSRPEHIRAVCDASLARLGIERIDLFYQHRVDPSVPIEDVAGTVGDLVREGKVRCLGLSEAGPETLRRAHATFPVTALQNEYSLWSRGPERDVLPVCRELGVGFVAYSPLGRGFLAGAGKALVETDFRRSQPRWNGDALSANLTLFDQVEAMAQVNDCTPAQLALAWLLYQGYDIVPIPGTSKVERLAENVGATDVILTPGDLATLASAMAPEHIRGARYDADGLALVEGA